MPTAGSITELVVAINALAVSVVIP